MKLKKFKSIQSKMLTVIISGMLILGLSISILCISYINIVLNDSSNVITESVANTEALRINESLNKIESTVKIMENYVLSTLDGVSGLTYETYLNAYSQSAKETFFAALEHTEVAVAFYLRFAPELTNNSVAGFFISCEAGGHNFSELTPTDLADWETAPYEKVCWYRVPKEKGEPTWLLPYHNPNNDVTMISYVIPLYLNRTFIGVVGIDMEFSTLAGMVDEISVYDNGFAYVSDGGDTVYYSAADEHTLNKAHTSHGFAEEVRSLNNGMNLVIHADYSDIQSDAYRMIIIIIVIMILVMAIFIFITFVITKKIVRPLKQITDAAGVIAEGKTDLDLNFCNTGDEVEILADSMKKTAEKLHGYMSYINALAYRDSLTGVKNLTAFKEATANIDVKISSGEYPSIAVVVCDINCLKKTNDRYGHEIGNSLIIKATKVICDIFKHSPVFRIGGDEFVVILEGEDFENREALISALDDACDNTFISAGEETIPVSIARGLELLNSEFDVSFVDAVNRADKKMYENKNSKSESKNI